LYQVNTIKSVSTETKAKAGSLVKQTIQEMKEEIKDYRKQLKKEAT
jgi:gas vesicle protein